MRFLSCLSINRRYIKFSLCILCSPCLGEPYRVLLRSQLQRNDIDYGSSAPRTADNRAIEETVPTVRVRPSRQRSSVSARVAAHIHTGFAQFPVRLSIGADAVSHRRS